MSEDRKRRLRKLFVIFSDIIFDVYNIILHNIINCRINTSALSFLMHFIGTASSIFGNNQHSIHHVLYRNERTVYDFKVKHLNNDPFNASICYVILLTCSYSAHFLDISSDVSKAVLLSVTEFRCCWLG